MGAGAVDGKSVRASSRRLLRGSRWFELTGGVVDGRSVGASSRLLRGSGGSGSRERRPRISSILRTTARCSDSLNLRLGSLRGWSRARAWAQVWRYFWSARDSRVARARASGVPGLGYVLLFTIYGALFLLSFAIVVNAFSPVMFPLAALSSAQTSPSLAEVAYVGLAHAAAQAQPIERRPVRNDGQRLYDHRGHRRGRRGRYRPALRFPWAPGVLRLGRFCSLARLTKLFGLAARRLRP